MGVVKVTPDWTQREVEETVKSIKDTLVYDVDFDNTVDPFLRPLLARIASDGTIAIPAMYSMHPYNPWLYVQSKSVRAGKGPLSYRVTVHYSSYTDTFDIYGDGEPINPLLQRPERSWRFALSNEPIDRDIVGNPLASSSGEAFDPQMTEDFYDLVLRYVRNEESYDKLLAAQYINAVNSDSFLGFNPGQVRCNIFDGEEARVSQNLFCRVTYEFQFRWDGWKRKITDQGFRIKTGTDANGKPKYENILDDKGNPVSQPVLLDGQGQRLAEDADLVVLEFETKRKLPFSVLNITL